MRLQLPLAAVLVIVALLAAAPGFAQSRGERLAAAEQQCSPGREARAAVASGAPLPAGAMPWQLPGAVTISPQETHCLIERVGLGVVVIAAFEKARSDRRNRSSDIDTLRAEANGWVDRFNAYLEQREASSARPSGGSGGYVPMPSSNPQPVRRAYGSSAAGIK